LAKRVVIIDGHPDPDPDRLVHAIAATYEAGVRDAGAAVRVIRIADLDFPLLRTAADFATAPDNSSILSAREDIKWAEHIVLVFPLWLGSAPALVRGFFEQVARGEFVAQTAKMGWKPQLKGKSARLIVTMGMPAFFYQTVFGAHGVSSWCKSILGFAGVRPIRVTLFGGVGAVGKKETARRMARVHSLGAAQT
jgi:putative NADPH-quinone reductase